jgi:hypothetical protein
VGGNVAYVGFTGSTGGLTAVQEVQDEAPAGGPPVDGADS